VVHTKPMRQHLLLCVGLLVLAVGGCAIARPAWPAGYREAVCAATAHLRAADDAFAQAADGIEVGDAERVSIAAAGMERASGDALDALDAAPGWEPGASLRLELVGASMAFGRAAVGFGIGARQGDGPALDGALALAQNAEASLGRADAEAKRLRTTIGWQPC
jgi:hypothetical protein